MLADVGLRYEFDLNGTPVSALQAGQSYVLKAFIRDNRPTTATGVLQAYFNVNYSSLVNIPSGQGVTAGAAYNWAPGGNVSTSGQIIGTGGELTFRTAYSPPTLEQLLYSVPFNATNAGTLTLTTAVDTLNSGNNVIYFCGFSNPNSVTNMSDVEVDGLTSPTLSPDGSTVTGTIQVQPAGAGIASRFAVSTSGSTTAGSTTTVTVTAQDIFGSTVSGYNGTVHFTSTDGAAVLPANATLTNGVGTFNVTFKTAGNQSVTATDTGNNTITGTTAAVTVSPAAATKFVMSASSAATAGNSIAVAVTAQDAYNNTVSNYGGTIHFSSTDSAAILPANATLTNGTGTFFATLRTAGNQDSKRTDTVNGSITGSTGTVSVSPAATAKLAVSARRAPSRGTRSRSLITAQDIYGNTTTGYGGTVHFTSVDPAAVLPANSTLPGGVGTFSVTLKTAGGQTVTATDTSNGSIAGNSGTISVSPPRRITTCSPLQAAPRQEA